MATLPELKVLFFDVFGTCVAQRPSVAKELSSAAQEALESDQSTISSEVREKAASWSYEDWDVFGAEWNKENENFVKASIADRGNVDWKEVDKQRIELLPRMLAARGLVLSTESSTDSEFRIQEGSLWNESQLQHLGRIWHRLTPWPDTCKGLELLNGKFATVALSNTYYDLMKSLIARSSIPFQDVYTSDLFNSYKPNPKVYLGAAEKMGVKPEECALVAAHLGDLKGAKACGFRAFYVDRPLEEKAPHLKRENIPELVITQDEEGFVALARHLGTQ